MCRLCDEYLAVAGVIQNHGQEAKFAFGELVGKNAGRIEEVSSLFRDAGFDAPVSDDIRHDLWVKLWGNLSGNSISAIAEGTCSVLGADPEIRSIMAEMMRESVAVAAAYGVELAADAAKQKKASHDELKYFRNLGDVPENIYASRLPIGSYPRTRSDLGRGS